MLLALTFKVTCIITLGVKYWVVWFWTIGCVWISLVMVFIHAYFSFNDVRDQGWLIYKLYQLLWFISLGWFKTWFLLFLQLYGAVTMNNVLCLSVFLALVYVRGLTWDFSSEVLVILVVCIVVGVFASFRTVFPLWTSIAAILLYPFSLALVYVLDYVFGWS